MNEQFYCLRSDGYTVPPCIGTEKVIVKQIAGNMALSEMELTDADENRIVELLDHPDKENAILQGLIDKHKYTNKNKEQ